MDDVTAITDLLPSSPNPFNSSTRITYTLSDDVEIDLKVFDLKERIIRTIISQEHQTAGSHSIHWNGRDDADQPAVSGTYILVLNAAQVLKTQKVILHK